MIKRVLEGASSLLAFAAGCAVILMMLHINLDVAMRYIFSAPFANTIEIVSTYYIVVIVFLPLALVERLNAHIVVELLAQHLPQRVAELLIACIALVSALYFGAFAWRTGEDALQEYDVGEIMLLTLPVFLPAMEKLGIDLIWYGVLMTKLLEIALITPPVGLNVFVIKGIVGNLMSTETIFKGILWFLVADIICVILLIAFPQITLYLPGLLK